MSDSPVNSTLTLDPMAAAQDADGRLLATATVTRVVVDRERFLARLPR